MYNAKVRPSPSEAPFGGLSNRVKVARAKRTSINFSINFFVRATPVSSTREQIAGEDDDSGGQTHDLHDSTVNLSDSI